MHSRPSVAEIVLICTMVIMIGLWMIPASYWHLPDYQLVQNGFDPAINYVHTSRNSNTISANVNQTGRTVELSSWMNSTQYLHLDTVSFAGDISTDFKVQILQVQPRSFPLTVEIQDPRGLTGYYLNFSDNQNLIQSTIVNRNVTTGTRLLGTYTPSNPVHFHVNRFLENGTIRIQLSGTNNPIPIIDSVTMPQAPSLFAAVPVSIAVRSTSITGMTHVIVTSLQIVVPNQPLPTITVNDPVATTSIVILASVGALVLAYFGWNSLRSNANLVRLFRNRYRPNKSVVLTVFGVAVLCIIYLIGNIAIFGLGAHYYDLGNAQIWSYIAGTYGLGLLYPLSYVSATPNPYTGIQAGASAFPYGPLMAYFFTLAGSIVTLISASPTQFMRTSQFVIKLLNVLFGLASSFVVYAILRSRGFKLRPGLIGMLFLLLNPLLWFIDSIWGETHSFTILLLLSSILFAQLEIRSLAWTTSICAILTRPEIVPSALLLMIFLFFRSTSIRKSIREFSLGIVTVFIVLTPIMLLYSPSLPVDVEKFAYGVQTRLDPVSASFQFNSLDSYNIWPIFTGILQGATGHGRLWTPSNTIVLPGISYLSLSSFLAASLLLFLALLMVFSKDQHLTRSDLSIIAAGALSLLMIRVGISVHAFLLAVPLVIIAMRPGRDYVSYASIAILSFTTLIATWGSIPAALVAGSPLYPSVNPLTAFLNNLCYADWFINVAVALNLAVYVWLIGRSTLSFGREISWSLRTLFYTCRRRIPVWLNRKTTTGPMSIPQ